jgi:SAM-dependent methyltransferase
VRRFTTGAADPPHAGRETLERAGLTVTGIERSGDMIAHAKDRIARLSLELRSQLTLVEGDATNYTPATKYDAVASLFHVVSYQTSNDALVGIYRCALTQLPTVNQACCRAKGSRYADRRAGLPVRSQCCENTLMAVDQRNGRSEEMVEVHSMRYLFLPEIEMLASQHDLVGDWLTGRSLDGHCWSGAVQVRPTANCS